MPSELLLEDTSLNEAIGMPKKGGWYPFGLTPFTNVCRLLPNHVLRLDRFEPVRISTPKPPESQSGGDATALGTIARNLRDQIQMLAKAYPLTVGLTAGNETRMILASLRGLTDSALLFTLDTGLQRGRVDVDAARRLAKEFGLKLIVIPRVRSAEDEQAWFERTGRCVSGGPLAKSTSKRVLPSGYLDIRGLAGEIARVYYYRPGDRADASISIETLLRRLSLPPHPTLLDAGLAWMEAVEAVDTYDLLDLLYIENRVGAWASTHAPGDITTVTCIWPLNQASTAEAMRGLSYEVKTQDRMAASVVRILWPELLRVPINKPFGVHRGEKTVRDLVRQGKRVLRKVIPAHRA